jgi:hypothetical protein
MDEFNYLGVVVSIILGVGITQLFGGLGNFFQVQKRVILYPLYCFWVIALILYHVELWWVFWEMRTLTEWSSKQFLLTLVGPGALVVSSYILIPEIDTHGFDLKDYYFSVRRPFFICLTILASWSIVVEPLLGLGGLFELRRIFQLVFLALFVSCAISSRKSLHYITAGYICLHLLLLTFVIRDHI